MATLQELRRRLFEIEDERDKILRQIESIAKPDEYDFRGVLAVESTPVTSEEKILLFLKLFRLTSEYPLS